MSPFKVALNGTEPPASSPTDPTALHRLPATPQSRVDQKYMDLIDHVLNCAEAADFPRKSLELNSMMAALSAIGPSAQDNNLPPPYPKIQYKNEFERHSKIGALGELYVCSLLIKLERTITHGAQVYTLLQHKLPGRVDLKHWQSNMRDHIRAHNQFREMPPWTGSETADIVLPDDDGGLTDLLIENGYLDGATWAGKKPLYYIEVKATMNDRRQFYMSGDQYLRVSCVRRMVRGVAARMKMLTFSSNRCRDITTTTPVEQISQRFTSLRGCRIYKKIILGCVCSWTRNR